jgi:hypothetical protein
LNDTAVRFNHNKPSRRSWGEAIFGGGGFAVHNSRIEPYLKIKEMQKMEKGNGA